MRQLESRTASRRRGFAQLRRLVRLHDPANPSEAEALRDQASLLRYLIILFSTTGVLNLMFFVLQFRPVEHPILPAIGVGIAAIYGALLVEAERWHRGGAAFEFLRRARLLQFGLGLFWGMLINGFAWNAVPEQHALVIGLALGVVSTPIICVPAAVAFSFFVPAALLSILAVALLGIADTTTVVAFTCFTLYAVVGIVCTNMAFNGRSEAQAALQREVATVKVFLREYQEGSPDWLWETDRDGRLRAEPPGLVSSLGVRSLETRELGELLRPAPAAEDPQELTAHLRKGKAFRDMVVTARGPSRQRWFSLTGHPVHDEDGAVRGFRGIGRDITERHEAETKMAYMASHDGLTGLLDRKAFVTRVEEACEARERFALVSIDLDDFKANNDNFGHHVGDALLLETARRIRSVLRHGDAAGRLGGDEFAVLFEGTDIEGAHAAASRLARSIAEPALLHGLTVVPSSSLGVAASDEAEFDAARIFLMADLALYDAKGAGKGAASRFEPAMEKEYLARLHQEGEFAAAIETEQISVAYQPIVDLMTGQVLCLEALARWNHPDRGSVSPAIFVQMAETSGLIDRLGEIILRRACRDAAGWPETVQVNVNLSPKQLSSGRFPDLLASILRETALPPERLGIEITENIFIDFSGDALGQLQAIRDLGVKIVLDDFGTGYSSLSYLRAIDVDGLKIDASFLRQLPDRKVEAIIRTVTRLTADLNIYLVAEGVERPDQLEWLRRNGIHFGQGFLLGRPKHDSPVDRIDLLI